MEIIKVNLFDDSLTKSAFNTHAKKEIDDWQVTNYLALNWLEQAGQVASEFEIAFLSKKIFAAIQSADQNLWGEWKQHKRG